MIIGSNEDEGYIEQSSSGKEMVSLPIGPNFAKLLVLSNGDGDPRLIVLLSHVDLMEKLQAQVHREEMRVRLIIECNPSQEGCKETVTILGAGERMQECRRH